MIAYGHLDVVRNLLSPVKKGKQGGYITLFCETP